MLITQNAIYGLTHFLRLGLQSFSKDSFRHIFELSIFLVLDITLIQQNRTKSYKNYLQNTQHVVLRNHPILSIGTERLACLNNLHGVQLGTLA